MSRARILADYVSSGDELAVTTATADAALPKAGGAMTGAITTNSTFDGVDIAVRDALHAPKANPTFTGTVAIPNVANLETAVVANTAKVTNSTNASDLASGTVADARMPNLTGAITTVEGAVATTIANDAVDSQHYAADSIDAEHYAPASVDTTAMAASVIGVKPHIIPNVLYPAVAGKGIDGTTTVTSFGTDFAISGYATLKYYYTDIKGSKPIKDPRIGSHFGSQRHKFKSLQLLEQETATHGKNVYSVDGREWIRAVEVNSGTVVFSYDATVNFIQFWNSSYVEIVGYFNNASYLSYVSSGTTAVRVTIDGGTEIGTDFGDASVTTPLGSRYVDAVSLSNFNLTESLGIHTLKIRGTVSNSRSSVGGIELIAQDTSNANNIQIPSQNVVSYGKKFTVAETKHYNPFAFKTDGTTAWASGAHNGTAWPIGTGSSTNIDTATSLGLAAWVSTNYYKPYNGGRVVKWIASDGTIKTSVNMMPPNARSVGNSSSLTNATAKANASIANNTFYPTMEAGAIDHSQAEVAKTFHFREFGNGSVNGNTNYDDFSTLDGDNSINDSTTVTAYVMDDGLTSMSGTCNALNSAPYGVYTSDTGDSLFVTFIGTGLTYYDENDEVWENLVQNLPYGTHIFEHKRNSTIENSTVKIDGVTVKTEWLRFNEFSFHQPKMPPIPEDAVIIADYMLMADFVSRSDSSADISLISKGVRRSNISRDWFFENTSGNGLTLTHGLESSSGFSAGFGQGSGNQYKSQLPSFCTNFVATGYSISTRCNLFIDDVDTAPTAISGGNGTYGRLTSDVTLGLHTVRTSEFASGYNTAYDFDLASPIHTSSHYQTFETPFLHELVGGDRNMEQTNLVVTPDGKTWDEVTRDVSYMGNLVLYSTTDTNLASDTATIILDEWRGSGHMLHANFMTKDFAIAYDRMICLKDGMYRIQISHRFASSNATFGLRINGTTILNQDNPDSGGLTSAEMSTINVQLKRGDFVSIYGSWQNSSDEYNWLQISKD